MISYESRKGSFLELINFSTIPKLSTHHSGLWLGIFFILFFVSFQIVTTKPYVFNL